MAVNSRFEWDNSKAASNWRSHGVTFDQAVKAISDPFATEWIDDREAYAKSASTCLACVMASYCT
jgi:uncharacterized DUF497 family protein